MKPSFETTTLIAAIGMIIYALYVVARYIIYYAYPTAYCYDLWPDIQERLMFDLLPLSLIIAGLGLYQQRPTNATRPFRILTICFFVALIGTLVFSPLYTYSIIGFGSIFPPIYWRVLLLIAGIIWFFMLRHQPLEDASPHSYQVTLAISMALLALPIVLETISGIALLSGREYVIGLNSGAIKTWVKFIAPVLPLIHFVFPSIKEINLTRNSHCVPGSLAERTFRRNKIFSTIMVIVSLVAFCLTIYCAKMLNVLYLRQDLYIMNHDSTSLSYKTIGLIGMYTFFVSAFIAWVVLSIMAFRQLPNPRGYKIYNIVCQIITWGSFGATFLAPDGMDEVFGTIFLISFCAFFITTAIRVISYSFPTGIDKLKGIKLKENAIIPD